MPVTSLALLRAAAPGGTWKGDTGRMGVLPAASLTLILGSLEPLPQNQAQCFSLSKYTLYSVAHNVKRPNHKLPSARGFPVYTAGVCCNMLEAQGRPGSASGLAGGAGVHEVRVKACLSGAHLGPMEGWKWAYMVRRSLPSGRKTAQMLSLEVVYVPGHIRPRDELGRFLQVRGRECGGKSA